MVNKSILYFQNLNSTSKYTGHKVLTCFADVESLDRNFNTTPRNYEFNWFKNGHLLQKEKQRLNSNGQIIEIIEPMKEPQPGIVLKLNQIQVIMIPHTSALLVPTLSLIFHVIAMV